MKNEEALKRLTSLEDEAQKLRKIIESNNEQKDITDRVKTFEDACKIASVDYNKTLYIHANDESCTKDEMAYKKLKIIALALNEGWKPNWEDSDEYKYYPWFGYNSGFGFSYSDCAGWTTSATIGSRLCFKTKELAMYAGKQFKDVYKDFLTL